METQEQEWIESPDGWGKTQPLMDANQENDDAGEEPEEAAVLDIFGNNDPRDSFSFNVVRGDHTNKITLDGFKLDAEETAQSTGVTLWQAAPRLATFLMQSSSQIQNKNVLEVGAGLGLCGIVAHHLEAQRVILSDGDTKTLQQMRHNVAYNTRRNGDDNVSSTIHCRQLLWGSSAQIESFVQDYGKFDVILGADVIYSAESIQPLFDTIVQLLEPESGKFILSRYSRWNNVADEVVFAAAKERRLKWELPEEGIYIFSFDRGER